MDNTQPARREPIINMPAVVLGLIVLMALVHLARQWIGSDADVAVLIDFAFIPARYGAVPPEYAEIKATGPMIWSWVTYALLHADATHITLNSIWLAVFGTPVARRFGAVRFLALALVTAAAGALAHYIAKPTDITPMIGASAVVSGFTAAALRFIFQMGGPLGVFSAGDNGAYHTRAATLGETVRSRKIMSFVLVWFGINLITGVASAFFSDDYTIAWQAHVGGFLAGLLLFDLFDRRS